MDKRTAIIEAAIAVFGEKGVEKTTVSDIVKRAGIAQGTYYLYFPSRLAVMGGIAEQVVARMLQRLQVQLDGLPPAAQLDALARPMLKNGYGQYLMRIVNNQVF